MPYRLSDPAVPLTRNRPPDLDEVWPNLLIGEFLRPEDIAWLCREHRVSTVFSLQDADDLAATGLDIEVLQRAYAAAGLRFERVPVPDYEPSRMLAVLDRLLAELAGSLGGGERVYLHCNAGMNRAPTVAIAYLHAHHGYSLRAACDLVRARRTCAPYLQLLQTHFGKGSR